MMKPIIFSLLLFCASIVAAEAQQPGPNSGKREQKIAALYAAYVTQQLNLTELEAQKFWPVHTQFESDTKAVGMNIPELERQQATLNIKKKYQARFSEILGSERTNRFYALDAGFRTKLVEEIRKRRQQKNGDNKAGRRQQF